jgi:hypothetical protein
VRDVDAVDAGSLPSDGLAIQNRGALDELHYRVRFVIAGAGSMLIVEFAIRRRVSK